MYQCLITPSIAFWTTVGSKEEHPGGCHCWKKNIKKPDWNLQKCIKPQYFWERDKTLVFWQAISALCSQMETRNFQIKKNTIPTVKHGSYVLGLLCCIQPMVPWMCAEHNETSRLSRNFRLRHTDQCQKALFNHLAPNASEPNGCIFVCNSINRAVLRVRTLLVRSQCSYWRLTESSHSLLAIRSFLIIWLPITAVTWP